MRCKESKILGTCVLNSIASPAPPPPFPPQDVVCRGGRGWARLCTAIQESLYGHMHEAKCCLWSGDMMHSLNWRVLSTRPPGPPRGKAETWCNASGSVGSLSETPPLLQNHAGRVHVLGPHMHGIKYEPGLPTHGLCGGYLQSLIQPSEERCNGHGKPPTLPYLINRWS